MSFEGIGWIIELALEPRRAAIEAWEGSHDDDKKGRQGLPVWRVELLTRLN